MSLPVTDYNKHVPFALRPFYSAACMTVFADYNSERCGCLFSEIVIVVITHSVLWCFFSSTVDFFFNYKYSGGASFFFPPSVQLFPCAVTTHCPHSSNKLILLHVSVGVQVNNKGGSGEKYKSQYPVSLFSSLLLLSPRLTFTLSWFYIVHCTMILQDVLICFLCYLSLT